MLPDIVVVEELSSDPDVRAALDLVRAHARRTGGRVVFSVDASAHIEGGVAGPFRLQGVRAVVRDGSEPVEGPRGSDWMDAVRKLAGMLA